MTKFEYEQMRARAARALHQLKEGGFKKIEFQWTRLGRKRLWTLPLIGIFLVAFIPLYAQQTQSLPIASFTITPANPAAGQLVQFDGSASSGTGHSWDFGDGSPPGSGVSINHTYTSAGTYHVTLTVGDAQGAVATLTIPVIVSGNWPPTASFSTDPLRPLKGTAVKFDATSTMDVDGTVVSYHWDFGDGSTNVTSSPVTYHTFAESHPNPIVTLTVTDNGGAFHSLVKEVDVRSDNDAPTAGFTVAPSTVYAGDDAYFNGTESFDPDGKFGLSFHWAFGDGTSDTTTNATIHRYQSPGTFNSTLTVTDDSGTSASAFLQVQVLPGLSVAITLNTAQGTAPLPVSFNATASGGQGPYTFAWAFGDGQMALGKTPVHNYTSPRNYQVQVLVLDSAGHVATDTVTIEVSSGTEGTAGPGNVFDFGSIQLLLGGIGIAAIGIVVSLLVYGFVLRRSRQQSPSSAQVEPDNWKTRFFHLAGESLPTRNFVMGMLGMYQKIRRRNFQ